MGGIISTRGAGAYVASEAHRVFYGRTSKPTDKGVIWLPGSHSFADTLSWDTTTWDTVQALCDNGFRTITGDISQTPTQGTFGNDTVVTRAGQLLAYLQGTIGVKAGKVHMVGGSGGATACINYARANPGNVASMCLFDPLVDIEDFYNYRTDAQVTQAEMDVAYGGHAAFTAAMPTHNPARPGNAAALAGIPMRLYYSTNDPYIDFGTVNRFAQAVRDAGGFCELSSLGAVGHSAQGLVGAGVADFFLRHP